MDSSPPNIRNLLNYPNHIRFPIRFVILETHYLLLGIPYHNRFFDKQEQTPVHQNHKSNYYS